MCIALDYEFKNISWLKYAVKIEKYKNVFQQVKIIKICKNMLNEIFNLNSMSLAKDFYSTLN